MTSPSESIILCEGYHDRSFWRGWLEERLRWKDARRLSDGSLGDALDPFTKKPIRGGEFAFLSPAGSFLRLRPCHGDSKVLKALNVRLQERRTKTLRRLIVNLDLDADDADLDRAKLDADGLMNAVEHQVRQADASFRRSAEGDFLIDGGNTHISLLLWSAETADATPELPAKQTLERFVCAALRSAYPDRAKQVIAWLTSRPDPPISTAGLAKEHAWSHMAGWYATHNCDDFYQAVWRDPDVAKQFEVDLRRSGAWRIAEALAS